MKGDNVSVQKKWQDLQDRHKILEKNKIILEERKRTLEQRLKEINVGLEAMGINPSNVDQAIANLEQELNHKMTLAFDDLSVVEKKINVAMAGLE